MNSRCVVNFLNSSKSNEKCWLYKSIMEHYGLYFHIIFDKNKSESKKNQHCFPHLPAIVHVSLRSVCWLHYIIGVEKMELCFPENYHFNESR